MTLREKVYKKFKGKCAYSGTPLKDDWQIDHIIPKIFFEVSGQKGVNDLTNLVPTQKIINHYKRGESLEEFRNWKLGKLNERLKKLPKNPKSPKSIKRKKYLLEVAEMFNITEDKPFNGVFYMDKFKIEKQ